MTDQVADVLRGYLARVGEELAGIGAAEGYVRLRARLANAPETPIDALEAVGGRNRLVILGPTGSGKTTILTRLAWRAAEVALQTLDAPAGMHDLPLVPVLADLAGTRDETSAARLVQRGFARVGVALALQTARTLVQQVPLLLLLDNLDRAWDRAVLRAYAPAKGTPTPNLRMVVACREEAWDEKEGQGWETAHLLPLTQSEVEAHLQARLSPGDIAALQNDPELWPQLRFPLFLAAATEGQPANRAAVMGRVIARLLPEGLSADDPTLGRLAMTLVAMGGKPLSRRRWQSFIQEEAALNNALLSGLLQLRESDDTIRFAHPAAGHSSPRGRLRGHRPPRLAGLLCSTGNPQRSQATSFPFPSGQRCRKPASLAGHLGAIVSDVTSGRQRDPATVGGQRRFCRRRRCRHANLARPR